MNQSLLVLQDGTEINLQDGASIGNMCVVCPDRASMVTVWEKLTNANLKQAQILTDGVVSASYTDLTLNHETSKVLANGSILTSFAIRSKTEIELMREELTAVKEGQELQDGAIADLGAITSAVAEKLEGGTQ